MEYIKMKPPTWESAVRVHIQALLNPEAPHKTKEGAVDEILRLARMFDDRSK